MSELHYFFSKSRSDRQCEIWPDFYVVWTISPGSWGQGVHFSGQKRKKMSLKRIANTPVERKNCVPQIKTKF